MPKRKRSKKDDDENGPFRRYSQELHKNSDNCKRKPPPILQTPDFGSPQKVWSLLCSKDEMNKRNWRDGAINKNVTSSFRGVLVDWLMEVCNSCKLHRETFYLAVDYFDRFLCISEEYPLTDLQLVATAALTIACKVEEIYPPKVAELADYSDGGCTAEGVLACEKVMLCKLEWNFNPVTAIHWMGLYLQLIAKMNENSPDSIKKKTNSSADFFPDDTIDSLDGSLSNSFLCSVDGINTALTDNTFDQMLPMNASTDSGHFVVEQSICIPKLMRDDFVQLANTLDILILDHRSLKFQYAEIAAAVLFCSYEPAEAIEEITSIQKSSIPDLLRLTQIITTYSEEVSVVDHKPFLIDYINSDDQHNIQTFGGNNLEALKEIGRRQKKKKQELEQIHQISKNQNSEIILKEKNV